MKCRQWRELVEWHMLYFRSDLCMRVIHGMHTLSSGEGPGLEPIQMLSSYAVNSRTHQGHLLEKLLMEAHRWAGPFAQGDSSSHTVDWRRPWGHCTPNISPPEFRRNGTPVMWTPGAWLLIPSRRLSSVPVLPTQPPGSPEPGHQAAGRHGQCRGTCTNRRASLFDLLSPFSPVLSHLPEALQNFSGLHIVSTPVTGSHRMMGRSVGGPGWDLVKGAQTRQETEPGST